MILANAQGEISQTILMRTLCCGTETLQRRASELGVQLRKNVYEVNKLKAKSRVIKDPQSGEVFSGYQEIPHVGDDLLLRQLYAVCGNRRYESLIIKGANKDALD